MKKVIVMRGVPGSGKSQYARGTGGVVVSADDFFVRVGKGAYAFDPTKLGEAHGMCLREFVEAVQGERPLVVVDNTNTTTTEAAPYMAVAAAYGYEAEIHEIGCDPLVAAKRNVHGVPEDRVLAMAARMSEARFPPWWKVVRV